MGKIEDKKLEILFIDESEVNKKLSRGCFIIAGLSISHEYLILLEEKLELFKKGLNVGNFKEFRDTEKIKRENKLEITNKIVLILKECKVSITSVIFSDLKEEYWKNYYSAFYFILERFFLKIKRADKKGIIICDSLPRKIEETVALNIVESIKNNSIILKGELKGKFRENIYPAIFFQNDEYSNILQVTDLICTSLQLAVREFKESNPEISIKGNEIILKELSPYLKLYWDIFEKGPFGISGWGIKIWD